jgi:hypothetical protein
MRDDDKALNRAAKGVMAGTVSRDAYRALHDRVMEARLVEFPPARRQPCGCDWTLGRRVWPTDTLRCTRCGAEHQGLLDAIEATDGPTSVASQHDANTNGGSNHQDDTNGAGIACADYRNHQHHHRLVAGRWQCDTCVEAGKES